jgi:regulation of enolase protein 1 (concanavalin A-like superfamily)
MTSFTLTDIPGKLEWLNTPLDWKIELNGSLFPAGSLTIVAGPETDWFSDPAGKILKNDAPVAIFSPPDEDYILSARVQVEFASPYDAGSLQVRVSPDLWAKLCFEASPHKPTVVSVFTRGVSDDCNSVLIDGHEIYLRLSRNAPAFAFHYSLDGKTWHFVRHFTLGKLASYKIGFSSQSPFGLQCKVNFSEITYRPGGVSDIRSGE